MHRTVRSGPHRQSKQPSCIPHHIDKHWLSVGLRTSNEMLPRMKRKDCLSHTREQALIQTRESCSDVLVYLFGSCRHIALSTAEEYCGENEATELFQSRLFISFLVRSISRSPCDQAANEVAITTNAALPLTPNDFLNLGENWFNAITADPATAIAAAPPAICHQNRHSEIGAQ